MDGVRGDFLGPPHGTTPAAVIANKNKTGSSISFINTTKYRNLGGKKRFLIFRIFIQQRHGKGIQSALK